MTGFVICHGLPQITCDTADDGSKHAEWINDPGMLDSWICLRKEERMQESILENQARELSIRDHNGARYFVEISLPWPNFQKKSAYKIK